MSFEGEGAFNGDATRDEPGAAPAITRTAGGSIVRGYPANDAGEAYAYANRRGDLYAEIVGVFAMQTVEQGRAPVPTCATLMRYTRDPFPAPVPIDSPSAEELAAAESATGVRFIEQADGSDYARWYPAAAMRDGVEGRVTMDCLIKADGYLRCAVASEEPVGARFGEAALQVSTRFRVAPETAEGVATVGRRIRRTIVFRPAS